MTTLPIQPPRTFQTFAIPGTPSELLAGMMPLAQQNLSTPYLPAEIAAALAAPGDVFFDTEIGVENGNVQAWGQNLRSAVQAVHAAEPHKRIGLFCLPMGSNANPYWQVVYGPCVEAAKQAHRAGWLDGMAWVSLSLYCDPTTLGNHQRAVNWYNSLLMQAAALRAARLPVMAFLSPYDLAGNPVDPTLFGEACILARGLLDMGLVTGVNLWAWRTAPWNGDVQGQIGQFRQYLGV